MSKLEKDLERDHRYWIEEHGCKSIKLWPMGRVGLPDRLIIGPKRLIYFVEWKRPGERPRKIQLFIHALIRSYGFSVYICTNLEEAKAIHATEAGYAVSRWETKEH